MPKANPKKTGTDKRKIATDEMQKRQKSEEYREAIRHILDDFIQDIEAKEEDPNEIILRTVTALSKALTTAFDMDFSEVPSVREVVQSIPDRTFQAYLEKEDEEEERAPQPTAPDEPVPTDYLELFQGRVSTKVMDEIQEILLAQEKIHLDQAMVFKRTSALRGQMSPQAYLKLILALHQPSMQGPMPPEGQPQTSTRAPPARRTTRDERISSECLPSPRAASMTHPNTGTRNLAAAVHYLLGKRMTQTANQQNSADLFKVKVFKLSRYTTGQLYAGGRPSRKAIERRKAQQRQDEGEPQPPRQQPPRTAKATKGKAPDQPDDDQPGDDEPGDDQPDAPDVEMAPREKSFHTKPLPPRKSPRKPKKQQVAKKHSAKKSAPPVASSILPDPQATKRKAEAEWQAMQKRLKQLKAETPEQTATRLAKELTEAAWKSTEAKLRPRGQPKVIVQRPGFQSPEAKAIRDAEEKERYLSERRRERAKAKKKEDAKLMKHLAKLEKERKKKHRQMIEELKQDNDDDDTQEDPTYEPPDPDDPSYRPPKEEYEDDEDDDL